MTANGNLAIEQDLQRDQVRFVGNSAKAIRGDALVINVGLSNRIVTVAVM